MSTAAFRRAFFAAVACAASFGAGAARAQEKVPTCIVVEAPDAERPGLSRLVASELDRHPSHRAVTDGCAAHLRVELIVIDGSRFLTGRVGGEVPDRVRVEGNDAKALEAALAELLQIVLGNDPAVLHAPGGRSWFSDKVFTLKERGRNSLDVAFLETASPVLGRITFDPGILVGFSRELEQWQVGVEGLFAQNLDHHDGVAALDTSLRLQATVTLFFGGDADVSTFAAASLGIDYERFSGPRGKDLGGGNDVYAITEPVVGLRAGVELFRTTSMRADVFADASIPMIPANDIENEVVQGWIPTLSLGAGARF